MGKIRVKTLGLPEEEKKEEQKSKLRKEAKKAQKSAKTPGLKGGERLKSMGPSEEDLAKAPPAPVEEKAEESAPAASKETKPQRERKKRGRNYHQAARKVDKNRLYSLSEAVDLLKKTSFVSFDASVEAHILTIQKGLSGNVELPHSTGKTLRIAVASDKVLSEIESGKINFDALVATPAFMPRLARVAKILGPRGLMPNPKAGTVTDEPEKVVEKLKGGQIRFKTEAESPVIHLMVGKLSFPQKNLEENLEALISAVGPSKIKKFVVSSSMGPGIKIKFS